MTSLRQDHHDHSHAHDSHSHRPTGDHGHAHGTIDPSIISSEKGLWAVKWSFIILFVTACLQVMVVFLSGSIALLADTIHNFGDASTAIPLGIAFSISRLKPTKRFSYGYGRVEDLAGMAVVLIILFSALTAGYEAINRFLHPQSISHIGAVLAASVLGFLGNETVAVFRIRVGKQIHSAALIADGYHARTDGWTSLAVLIGAVGVYFGYPLADPVIGLGITIAIFFIVWDSMKTVFVRALDGVEAGILDELEHAAKHVAGVKNIRDVRARWIGHELHAQLTISIDPSLSIKEGNNIVKEVQHELYEHISALSFALVHLIPNEEVRTGT